VNYYKIDLLLFDVTYSLHDLPDFSFMESLTDGSKILSSSSLHFVEKCAWMRVYGCENVKHNVGV
jgi:hypothetical protein